MAITVCRLPPGTSTCNTIEPRLCSFIPRNRRGKPRVSDQTIVPLLTATTTRTGLTVKCEIDPASSPAGVQVSDDEMSAIKIIPHQFHAEWTDTIAPRPS